MSPNSPWSTVILIALMVAAFYFLIIRPGRKRQQVLQQTLSSLTPGTRVMLTSGVFGTVASVGERQVVIETSPGVELTVLKQAVARVATAADEDLESDESEELEDEDLEPGGLLAEPGPPPTGPSRAEPTGFGRSGVVADEPDEDRGTSGTGPRSAKD
jgi:preprotein translocase subunit YajC